VSGSVAFARTSVARTLTTLDRRRERLEVPAPGTAIERTIEYGLLARRRHRERSSDSDIETAAAPSRYADGRRLRAPGRSRAVDAARTCAVAAMPR
jgi:hypothetical protein